MTVTGTAAIEAMLAHHAALLEGVATRVDELSSSVARTNAYGPAAAELVAYLAEEVLPHAMAEEHTIYPAAAVRPSLAGTVAGMVDEHRRLGAAVERLARAGEAATAVGEAEAIASLFAAHVAKENELVLPPLAADDTADLAGLLAQMHRLMEAATKGGPAAAAGGPDIERTLSSLLLDAADALAGAGRGDQACRLAAAGWAALRAARPDLAVRLTAALHHLARGVPATPVRSPAGRGVPAAEAGAALDVRTVPPAERHEQIFAAYGALAPGASFELVNDHDPKPLRYQFEAEYPGRFSWDYLEAGPRVWRVRIGRRSLDGTR